MCVFFCALSSSIDSESFRNQFERSDQKGCLESPAPPMLLKELKIKRNIKKARLRGSGTLKGE